MEVTADAELCLIQAFFFFKKKISMSFAFDVVLPCFPMVASFSSLVLPEKYIFQRKKKKSLRSSQLRLIILKNFLPQFLLRFVKKSGSFQDK